MITHDVDEAIYLADKIVLMTNGPGAVLAEIVDNPLPQRSRPHRPAQASATITRCATTSSTSWSRAQRRPFAATTVRQATTRATCRPVDRAGLRTTADKPRAAGGLDPATALGLQPTDARDSPPMTNQRRNCHETRTTSPKSCSTSSARRAGPGSTSARRSAASRRCSIVGAIARPDETDQAAGGQRGEAVRPVKDRRGDAERSADARHGTPMPPTDPLIYRFYEMVMVNGPAWKALIEEEFGDGIMSAIDFDMAMERVPTPRATASRSPCPANSCRTNITAPAGMCRSMASRRGEVAVGQ